MISTYDIVYTSNQLCNYPPHKHEYALAQLLSFCLRHIRTIIKEKKSLKNHIFLIYEYILSSNKAMDR